MLTITTETNKQKTFQFLIKKAGKTVSLGLKVAQSLEEAVCKASWDWDMSLEYLIDSVKSDRILVQVQ